MNALRLLGNNDKNRGEEHTDAVGNWKMRSRMERGPRRHEWKPLTDIALRSRRPPAVSINGGFYQAVRYTLRILCRDIPLNLSERSSVQSLQRSLIREEWSIREPLRISTSAERVFPVRIIAISRLLLKRAPRSRQVSKVFITRNIYLVLRYLTRIL